MMRSMHWVRRLILQVAADTSKSNCTRLANRFCVGALTLAMGQSFASAQTQLAQATIGPGANGIAQQVPQLQTVPQAAPQLSGAQQHPLVPALEMAYKSKAYMDANLRDYSATVVKQERIDGVLGENEFAFIKVRNQPFSVYMSFIKPEKLEGQECMYIAGQNGDKMYAPAPPGTLRGKFGTVSISPT